MRVGVVLAQHGGSLPGGPPPDRAALVGWARRAEAVGCGSVWLDDGGDGPVAADHLDPFLGLAWVGRSTAAVAVGVLGLVESRRRPSVAAKALASLDAVTGGRAAVVVGPPRPARAPGAPPDERDERAAEELAIVRAMLGGGPVTWRGRHHHVEDAPNRPAATRRIPLVVRADDPSGYALAAEHGDGWATSGHGGPAAHVERGEAFAAACRAAGRDPGGYARVVVVEGLVGDDRADLARRWDRLSAAHPDALAGTDLASWADGRLVGEVGAVAATLREWRDLGVDDLVVTLGAAGAHLGGEDDLDPLGAAATLARCRR